MMHISHETATVTSSLEIYQTVLLNTITSMIYAKSKIHLKLQHQQKPGTNSSIVNKTTVPFSFDTFGRVSFWKPVIGSKEDK